jgi:hypothetical protein
MSTTDHRKQSLYFPEDMLSEIQRQAERQLQADRTDGEKGRVQQGLVEIGIADDELEVVEANKRAARSHSSPRCCQRIAARTNLEFQSTCGIAVVALYRAVAFNHELSHQSPGALPGFRFAWDLLVEVYKLDVNRLWFSVFEGDSAVPAEIRVAMKATPSSPDRGRGRAWRRCLRSLCRRRPSRR